MFVVAQQHAVSGAQDSELWLNVIDELMGKTDASTTH
jgi:predicted DsbA family dithiol-disulfide isomerase